MTTNETVVVVGVDGSQETTVRVVDNQVTVLGVSDIGPAGPQGPTGPVGPVGPPGPVQTLAFRHQQQVAAMVWTINHGLGFRPAGILVTDSAGNTVEGVVDSNGDSSTVLSFAFPFTGTADLS